MLSVSFALLDELVTQLLWEAIVPKEEQEQVEADEVHAATSGGLPMSR